MARPADLDFVGIPSFGQHLDVIGRGKFGYGMRGVAAQSLIRNPFFPRPEGKALEGLWT